MTKKIQINVNNEFHTLLKVEAARRELEITEIVKAMLCQWLLNPFKPDDESYSENFVLNYYENKSGQTIVA